MTSFLNIAAYKFIKLDELSTLQSTLKAKCNALNLRGTILLSPEGINIMLTGKEMDIRSIQQFFKSITALDNLHYKESPAAEQTFNRMLVKIKNEIIAFGIDSVDPINKKAPYIKPEELKQWLDENRDIVLLDTRNDYEINLGTFDNALSLNIHHFRDFPKAVKASESQLKNKTIVTFCTGGIRCEKAALYLQQEGFQNVYQLEDGILGYFEQCGGAHYHGECFVFDRRVGLDPSLNETGTLQCFNCLHPVNLEEQKLSTYIPDISCPHCHTHSSLKESHL